jgi:DEAD/DEAH box helicase domain-containing protein
LVKKRWQYAGYPGSVSSLWQQAGRAGRGGRNSLAVMIMFDGVLDQYFVQRPATLLTRSPEAAVIDVANEVVLRSHLLCAAAECPLGILQVLALYEFTVSVTLF